MPKKKTAKSLLFFCKRYWEMAASVCRVGSTVGQALAKARSVSIFIYTPISYKCLSRITVYSGFWNNIDIDRRRGPSLLSELSRTEKEANRLAWTCKVTWQMRQWVLSQPLYVLTQLCVCQLVVVWVIFWLSTKVNSCNVCHVPSCPHSAAMRPASSVSISMVTLARQVTLVGRQNVCWSTSYHV